jgi:predicted nucleic acid-binding protein
VTRAFIDANVFLYATGGDHPYRQLCLEVLAIIKAGLIKAESSVEVAQEVAHARFRRSRDRATARKAGDLVCRSVHVHAVEPDDLERALDLFERHDRVSMRDAIHAATALNRGMDTVISADRGFDEFEELTRIDPADKDALAKLTG